METPVEQDVDALGRLETRIVQAAELVARLRREKDAAVEERETALREATEARMQASKLSKELETLRAERLEVRARIERLLGQMDLLGGG
ncbi:MAG: cell division protein ZapB [Bryobacteraceae bacterium]